MKRICVNVTDEQAAALAARTKEDGIPQSEQIRRALANVVFGRKVTCLWNNGDNASGIETVNGFSFPISWSRPPEQSREDFRQRWPEISQDEVNEALLQKAGR